MKLWTDDELIVRYTRGSGPGGQHKNKVETCCYIKHIPTGIEVKADGRSKTSNYNTALEELEKRLENLQLSIYIEKYRESRNKALSVGRIRTYNFQRGTVLDHRTGKIAPLKKIMDGDIELLR